MAIGTEPALRAQPPSSKFVYYVLAHAGTANQQELVDETRLSPRTVRSALSRLEAEGLVDSRMSIQDARVKRYSLPS